MRPEDLKDALLRRLVSYKTPPRATERPGARTGKGRSFLTERDVRKALTPGTRDLRITEDAIVSPLALDWLALQGIRIVRSS